MALNADNITKLGDIRNVNFDEALPGWYTYRKVDETIAQVMVSGYFNAARAKMPTNSIIEILASDGRQTVLLTVPADGVSAVTTSVSGKIVRGGQATTVAAVDTIVTGLKTVTAVVVSLDSDPIDDPEWVTGSIGDQAGAPVAGSFLLKTWKNTAGNDPTPAAATTFGKKVNWIAYGTL